MSATQFSVFGNRFTLTNYWVPYVQCRLAGLKGNEELQQWYLDQATPENQDIGLGPGPTGRMHYSYQGVKKIFQELPRGLENGTFTRGNELGMQMLNTVMFPETDTINVGFSLQQHAETRPYLGKALDGAEQSNKKCDGSTCWNTQWLRGFLKSHLTSMKSLSNKDPKWLFLIVLHKILLDMDLSETEAKSFATFQKEFLKIAGLPPSVAQSFVANKLVVQAAFATKMDWMNRYKVAIKKKWPNGPWNDPRRLELMASVCLDTLAFAGGLSVQSVATRVLAMTVNRGSPSLLNLGYEPGDLKYNASLLEDLIWESVRLWPPVSTVPYWSVQEDGSWAHELPQLRMAGKDPTVFPNPLEFQLGRPGLNSQNNSLSINWADFALVDGNVANPNSRSCPGKQLSMAMVKSFMQAYLDTGPWIRDPATQLTINTYMTDSFELTKARDAMIMPTPTLGPGVALGLLMLMISVLCNGWFHFSTYLKNPTLEYWNTLPPALFLRVIMINFMCLNITGFVLTYFFSGVDWKNNVMIEWYGYNNICILYDFPPATYVLPIFWIFTAGGYLVYAGKSTMRARADEDLPAWAKILTHVLNLGGIFVIFGFSLIYAVHPYDNMYAHSFPFVALIFAQPLVYLNTTLDEILRKRGKTTDPLSLTWPFYLAVFWTIDAVVLSVFILKALLWGPGAYWPTFLFKPLDYTWVGMAFAAPWLLDRSPSYPTRQHPEP